MDDPAHPHRGASPLTHPTYLLISPHSGLLLVGGRPAIRRTASVRATAEAVDQALAHNLAGQHPVRAVLAVDGKTLHDSHVAGAITIVSTIDLARVLHRSDVVLTQVVGLGGGAGRCRSA